MSQPPLNPKWDTGEGMPPGQHQDARAAYQAGWNDARQAAVEVCLGQADQTDGRLPDAHGGNFAKKFAANNLRGAAGLIRKLVPGAQG